MRPWSKWFGGKRRYGRLIREVFPGVEFTTIVEPFGGLAGVSHSLEPPHAIICDTIRPLIDTYRAIARGLEPPDWPRDKETWYKVRDANRFHPDSQVDPTVTLYLLRNTTNGLCRFSSKGFNSTWGVGAVGWDGEDYRRVYPGWEFHWCDYSQCPPPPTPETTLLFVDPPYPTDNQVYSSQRVDYGEVFAWVERYPARYKVFTGTECLLPYLRGWELSLDHSQPKDLKVNRTKVREVFAWRSI